MFYAVIYMTKKLLFWVSITQYYYFLVKLRIFIIIILISHDYKIFVIKYWNKNIKTKITQMIYLR